MAHQDSPPPARPRVVDVHAHFIPAAYRAALVQAGMKTLDGGMPIPDWSIEAAIAAMDRQGVDRAILSVSSPGLTFVGGDEAAALARAINDAAAAVKAEGKGRFGAFASLPVGDVDDALQEIDRALDGLGLDGVILETNHRGVYPGDAAMAPILAELDRRGACVFLHPTSPTCLHCLSSGRPAPLVEFPFETTRAVVDLLYSGTLARHPRLKLILAHAGGVLPFLSDRIGGFARLGLGAAPGVTPASISAQLASLYYDTALSTSEIQMRGLRALTSIDHILFGSDWPFSPEPILSASLSALRALPDLSDEQRAAILGGNTERLLSRRA